MFAGRGLRAVLMLVEQALSPCRTSRRPPGLLKVCGIRDVSPRESFPELTVEGKGPSQARLFPGIRTPFS